MIAMLLVATMLSASPAPVDARCEPLHTPLRVRVTVGSDQWADAEPVIKKLIEQTWSRSGLQITWAPKNPDRHDTDFWIAVVHGMETTSDGGVLGMVKFTGDRPEPLAHISIDAVRLWVRLHQARLFHTPVHNVSGRLEDSRLMHRVLGYAAAHEMGHFLLSTKTHASKGVMQAAYSQPALIADASGLRLDDDNARLLRVRISNCAAS